MALVSNIKWYINWNERGVHEPAPSLLTYEEIVAMATSEWYPWTTTIAELNTNSDAYYNIMHPHEQWTIWTIYKFYNIIEETSTTLIYYLVWNTSQNIFTTHSSRAPK